MVLTDRQQFERETWNKRAKNAFLSPALSYKIFLREYKRIISSTKDLIDFSKCEHILDIGCGRGFSSLAWAKLLPKARVLGVDISPEMVNLCIEHARALGLEDRCTFRVANVHEKNRKTFGNKPFDLIFGRMVLHHFNFNELSSVASTLRALCHDKTTLLFVENNNCNTFLMWFRDHVSGRFGIPKSSLETEYPLDRKRIDYLARELGSRSRIVYHEMVVFRLLNRIPAFRLFIRFPFLKWLDSLLFQVRPFRKLSYHQLVLFKEEWNTR